MNNWGKSATSGAAPVPGTRSWVEIDLTAVAHNVRTLKSKAGSDRLLMACVKSDAYGHGLVPVARAAEEAGADRLAVAHVDEGLKLRQAGIKAPIQVLTEPPPEAVGDMARHELIASLSSLEKVEPLAAGLKKPLTVHVEVDTGMGRVSLKPEGALSFLEKLVRTGRFEVEGLFSHFSSAGSPDNPAFDRLTRTQLETFVRLCDQLARDRRRIALRHMAGSDAVAFYPESYLDMIRPGAWVYGYRGRSVGLDLRPVLAWRTRILRVTRVPAGSAVGYEMSFRPTRDTTVAHIPVGYGDGYPRALSGLGEVLINGRRAPVVGLVGMESIMVDVGHIPGQVLGREVTLIGRDGPEQITATELAGKIGLFGVMITCGIKEKIERIYLN